MTFYSFYFSSSTLFVNSSGWRSKISIQSVDDSDISLPAVHIRIFSSLILSAERASAKVNTYCKLFSQSPTVLINTVFYYLWCF